MIEFCEQLLCERAQKRFCLLFGRGASALMAAYHCVDETRPLILIPDTICLSPVYACIIANKIPVFIDVDPITGTIDPSKVSEFINQEPRVGAVLGAHMFGHQADIDHLQMTCRQKGILLIEDAAQSILPGFQNATSEISGDLVILSFGHTKILEAKSGGGAVLTDNPELAKKLRYFRDKLKENLSNENLKEMSALYSRLYYSITDLTRITSSAQSLFYDFHKIFRPLFERSISETAAGQISEMIQNAAETYEKRQIIRRIYDSHFANIRGLSIMPRTTDKILWRYSVKIQSNVRRKVLDALRSQGFDVSSWYPPAHSFFDPGYATYPSGCPEATKIGDQIMNFWITENYDAERIAAMARLITSLVQDI